MSTDTKTNSSPSIGTHWPPQTITCFDQPFSSDLTASIAEPHVQHWQRHGNPAGIFSALGSGFHTKRLPATASTNHCSMSLISFVPASAWGLDILGTGTSTFLIACARRCMTRMFLYALCAFKSAASRRARQDCKHLPSTSQVSKPCTSCNFIAAKKATAPAILSWTRSRMSYAIVCSFSTENEEPCWPQPSGPAMRVCSISSVCSSRPVTAGR